MQQGLVLGGLVVLSSTLGLIVFVVAQYQFKTTRGCPQLGDYAQVDAALMGGSQQAASSDNAVPLVVAPTRMPLLPHSADCGTNPYFVVGVLASPSPRSRSARESLRQTWFKLPADKPITIRFLLAVDAEGKIPPELAAEADEKKDMIFLDTLEKYANLAQKVTLFFKWASDYCPTARYVLKTDDDSFVRPNDMLKRLEKLPSTRLYYGRGLGGMPARDKNGQPRDGNIHNMPVWPPYMSGGGYVLTMDLARIIGNPPVPYFWLKNEDVATGLRLYPYNITFYDDKDGVRPWGHCTPEAVLLHYQRRPGLMQRRYERTLAGKNICGEPFPHHVQCLETDEGKPSELRCPAGKNIAKIHFASWGQQEAECGEGFESFVRSDSCHAPQSEDKVLEMCLGKPSCSVPATNQFFGVDPCPRESKKLRVVAECA